MKRVLVALATLSLIFGACGGDDDGNNSSESGDKAAETAATGEGSLKDKLLDASDLPDGFTRTSAEETDKVEPAADANREFCPELQAADQKHPGERRATAQLERTIADKGGIVVSQQITRHNSAEESTAAFDAFEAALRGCKRYEATGGNGAAQAVSIDEIQFSPVGDARFASTFVVTESGAAGAAQLQGYLVAMREGPHIVLLFSLGVGEEVPQADMEAIAEKAAAKLSK